MDLLHTVDVLEIDCHLFDTFLIVAANRQQKPQLPRTIPSRVKSDALPFEIVLELLQFL